MPAKDAINDAVDCAIKENLLDGFFRLQKEEILGMSLTEYDEEEVAKDLFEEGKEVGHSEGAREKAI